MNVVIAERDQVFENLEFSDLVKIQCVGMVFRASYLVSDLEKFEDEEGMARAQGA